MQSAHKAEAVVSHYCLYQNLIISRNDPFYTKFSFSFLSIHHIGRLSRQKILNIPVHAVHTALPRFHAGPGHMGVIIRRLLSVNLPRGLSAAIGSFLQHIQAGAAISPSVKAVYRSAPFTTGPLATLIRTADFFILFIAARSIRFLVLSLNGQCRERMSDAFNSVSKSTLSYSVQVLFPDAE